MVHKEVTEYEIPKDNSTTDKGAEDQLALQICNSLVIIDKQQPGSPERTREPWALDIMPTITPATYPTQQTQP